jgi:hypothetical protein
MPLGSRHALRWDVTRDAYGMQHWLLTELVPCGCIAVKCIVATSLTSAVCAGWSLLYAERSSCTHTIHFYALNCTLQISAGVTRWLINFRPRTIVGNGCAVDADSCHDEFSLQALLSCKC